MKHGDLILAAGAAFMVLISLMALERKIMQPKLERQAHGTGSVAASRLSDPSCPADGQLEYSTGNGRVACKDKQGKVLWVSSWAAHPDDGAGREKLTFFCGVVFEQKHVYARLKTLKDEVWTFPDGCQDLWDKYGKLLEADGK